MNIVGNLLVSFILAQDPGAGAVEEWIERLGAEEIETRDQAQRELLKIGDPAAPSLRKAMDDPDLERASRARSILARIEKRNEAGGKPSRTGTSASGAEDNPCEWGWFWDAASGWAFRSRVSYIGISGSWFWPFWEFAHHEIIRTLPH